MCISPEYKAQLKNKHPEWSAKKLAFYARVISDRASKQWREDGNRKRELGELG